MVEKNKNQSLTWWNVFFTIIFNMCYRISLEVYNIYGLVHFLVKAIIYKYFYILWLFNFYQPTKGILKFSSMMLKYFSSIEGIGEIEKVVLSKKGNLLSDIFQLNHSIFPIQKKNFEYFYCSRNCWNTSDSAYALVNNYYSSF